MYKLSKKSTLTLAGVNPKLVNVVNLAIELTETDFSVSEGLRSVARQKELVRTGKSKTMNSRHITGHAVDLWPWPLNWDEFKDFLSVAEAVRLAAIELKTEVLWGSAWNMALNYQTSAKAALDSYKADRKSKGKSAFIDGPHFQLTWREFP